MTIIAFIASRANLLAAINWHYLGMESGADRRHRSWWSRAPGSSEEMLTRALYRVLVARDAMEPFTIAFPGSMA